jgi:hypothetical protein
MTTSAAARTQHRLAALATLGIGDSRRTARLARAVQNVGHKTFGHPVRAVRGGL